MRTSIYWFKLPLLLMTVVLLACAGCTDPVYEEPVVFANGEELHGAWEGPEASSNTGIAAFKGIPFAAPPIDENRWRAPLANQARQGPQKALEFAAACMQTSYITDWYASVAETFGHGPEAVGRPNSVSEDCLYLNVWSPQLDADAALPVMIWVHGGSNKGGWSYEPNYMGTKLAAKGVVVVTIAYRLGAFGFFTHPVLNNGEGEPVANFGLLDVERATRWVKDNIKVFGGEPDNITLIGESAGAGNISDLLALEIAEDPVYQHVILQSSASGLGKRRTLEDEQTLGQSLVESLGLEAPVTADQLRAIPAADLLAVSMDLKGHYFNAVIDGLTLKLSPLETLKQMDGTGLDLMIGTNADEWFMYIDEDATQDDLEAAIRQGNPEHFSTLLAEVESETNVRRAIDRIRTAGNTLCPSRYLAARITAAGGRGWVYYFTRQRPGPGGQQVGAYHGTEIPYVFDMHDNWLPTQEIDREITAAVMDYWVQFARNGDPNLDGRSAWPLYEAARPMVIELGDKIRAVKAHDTGLCELLGPR